MNFNTIRITVGIILCIEAAFMLPSLLLGIADGDAAAIKGFGIAIGAVLAVGRAVSSAARMPLSARATALPPSQWRG